MGTTVSGLECNYQDKVTSTEVVEALSSAQCHHCGTTTQELTERGELLEVCGEMFGIDMDTGERIITPISLCPECHRRHHLHAERRHRPCQIEAAFSREGTG